MDKKQVAHILEQIAVMIEIREDNPFRSRAYEKAARAIEMLDEDIEIVVREKRLGEVDGIGKVLEGKIAELILTGHMEFYEELKSTIPDTIFEVLKIPGLGPKRVKVLYQELGISNIEQLEYACHENQLLGIPGFGKKLQDAILKGTSYYKKHSGSFRFYDAYNIGKQILQEMSKHPAVEAAALGGSIRRRKEIINDIDLLVGSSRPEEVVELFISLPGVEQVTARGGTKAVVRLFSGMPVDLRVVSLLEYPYALHHVTGSKEHNIAMRHHAGKLGIKMNEYGLFAGEGEELIQCKNESEIFRELGMAFIPPEIREGTGEVEAALLQTLPCLVEEEDIKGVFHAHTSYSDGMNEIAQIAATTQKLGYKYIGISDHSQTASYAGGLKVEDIRRQHREIDELNKGFKDFRIFKGIESEILSDGSLDYPDDILATFDFVIASVHSRFSMAKQEMTQRILNALDNPFVTMLGHPTGRLLLSREEYQVDMEAVLKRAADRGVIVEINANPQRMDLDWRWCRRAKELGVKFAINPDAHDINGFEYITCGVGIARKGWLEKADIINCLEIEAVQMVLHSSNDQRCLCR